MKKTFFCGVPGEIFFDTRSDGNKQFFSLGPITNFCLNKAFIIDCRALARKSNKFFRLLIVYTKKIMSYEKNRLTKSVS